MPEEPPVYALCLTRDEMLQLLRAFKVFAEIMIPKVEDWKSWLDMQETDERLE